MVGKDFKVDITPDITRGLFIHQYAGVAGPSNLQYVVQVDGGLIADREALKKIETQQMK